MEIVLGTAQFGLDYGVTNSKGKVTLNEIEKILDVARQSGIKEIDTALNYGDALEVLNKFDLSDFNVTSKIPLVGSVKTPNNKIQNLIEISLEKFKNNKVSNMIFHDENDFYKYNNYSELEKMKAIYDFISVGVSLYKIDSKYSFNDVDLIQVPGSIIDRRFLNLNHKNMYLRSIFLQGVLLSEKRLNYFEKWSFLFEKYDDYVTNFPNKISAIINFLNNITRNTKVVVGVTNSLELKNIIKYKDYVSSIKIPDISSIDEDLIYPGNWGI